MAAHGFSASLSGGQFNTLAQSGTARKGKRPITVKGEGTQTGNTFALTKRAKRKVITQKITLALIDVATKRGEREKVKAYWNTYHCQSNIVGAGDRLYGNFCKNRFCTLCAGIRKAEIINKYLPVIERWKEPYLVTLTSKAVPAKWIKGRMENTLRAFKRIVAKYRKRSQRGKGRKLIGIRSLECNFNPERRTYNPHLHLIVPDKETADILKTEWLCLWRAKHTNIKGQHIRKVENKTRDLIEVVKYGSKIFTDPTMAKKAKRKVSPYVYVSAFHNIIWAMDDHRVFDRFGFNLPNNPKAGKRTILTEYETLIFDPQLFNWVSPETGALLTEYQPTRELMAILEGNLDMDLE